jgi:hypothetical protein
VVVELEPGTPKSKRPAVRTALLQIARAHDITNRIDTVWFHSGFPVDVRHNAKLHRPELSAWARSNPPT